MRLDDLAGGDAPVPSDYARQKREVEQFLARLTELEEDPDYLFAYDTISGIRTTVSLNSRVTTGQRDAIANIVNGVEERKDHRESRNHRYSRRYEGFSGRR